MPIINLRGLRGLSDLNKDERNAFIQKQISAGLLSSTSSFMDADRLYKNGEFYKKYGADAFNSMTPEQRDALWENDFINEARSRDITKESVGEDNYNKIMGLTPQGVLDLVDSGWDTDDYISMPNVTTMTAAGAGIGATIGGIIGGIGGSAAMGAGAVPGAALGAWSGGWLGTKIGLGVGMAGAAIESFWNNNTDSKLNAVIARDNDRKSEIASEILPQVSSLLEPVLNGSALMDEGAKKKSQPIISALQAYGVDFSKGEGSDINKMFEKVVGKNTPYWEMFKDRHELSDITEGDKLAMIQKTLATDLTFQDGGYSSMSINNQNIQNHVSDNQSWDDWAYNTGKNLVVGTVGALGETVAGTAALGAYAVDEANGLIGSSTNYTRNILEGKDEQGNEMPLLLNLSYWDGVDKFNTFDSELIEKIRETGGISPYNNVSLAGEEGRFFSWQSLNEAIKMGKYAAATRVTSGILGTTSSNLAKFNARTARKLGISATKSEAIGTFTNKWGSMGTYLAAGVPVSAGYGLGAYEDTKLNLTQKEDERQAKDLYEQYLKSEEYQNRVAEIEKELLTPRIDDNGAIHNLYSKEGARKAAEAQVQSDVASYLTDYVKNNRDKLSNSNSDYKANRDNIERIAVDAYALDATIEGAKNTFVNLNFRNYLFNKGTTEMIKGAKGTTTPVRFNPKTGKVEQVSKGIRGQEVAPDVRKDIARAVGGQLWSGFFSNYTDDITTGFVEAGAEKRYDNYLVQRYNGKAAGSLASYLGNLYDVANASLQGAEAKARDQMSWYDGFIGALGSVSPGSGGLPSLSQYNNNTEQGRGSKLIERLVRTTGVGATAYDTYYQNRLTSEAVSAVNKILEDRKLDLVELLDFASATNTSDISSENGPVVDAKTDKAKALLTAMLYIEKNRDNPVVMTAPQLQRVLQTLDALRDKNFGKSKEHQALISNLAYDFLSQPENKDIASLPQEEAEKQALDRVTHNLDKARSLVKSMDEAAAEFRIANPKASPDAVGQMVTLKVMADQYKSRIEEMEEALGIAKGSTLSRSLSAEGLLARYSTKASMQSRLETLTSMEKNIKSELESVKSEMKKAKKKDKVRISHELSILNKMLDETLTEKSLSQEALNNYFSEEGNTSSKVLSKEEIMSLDAASRAVILNFDETSNLYTPEQRQVIRAILKEYTEQGNALNAKELFGDIATLKGLYDTNLEVYSDNINNPELLQYNILNKAALFKEISEKSKLDVISSHTRSSVDEIRNTLKYQGKTDADISDSVYKMLRQSVSMEALRYMKDRKDFEDFSDEIKRAIEYQFLVRDVDNTVESVGLEEGPVRNSFIQNVVNTLKKVNSRIEFLDELGKIIESSDVEASAKVPYEQLLNELEQLWNQRASTTSMTREERVAAQKEHQRKLAEETQRRQEAEEAARAEAERKAAEAAAAGISPSDADTSNDRDAELAAHGLTDKDTTTDNESTLSPDEAAKAAEEGNDVNLESPTIEEQVAAEPDKVNIIPVLTDDSTDQGNFQVTTSGDYVGNTFYEYDIDSLKYHGKQVRRKGNSPDDIMSKIFNWLESAGIKLQDIIDTELSDILKSDPDIYPMLTDMRPNATNDRDVSKTVFLTVEYSSKVQNIHNNELGGIITSNGKQYLIIGIMGSQKGNNAQKGEVFEIMKDMQVKRKRAFDANPSERFFVDRSRHTKVVGLTAGRLVRQLTTDSEVQIRTISELLADKTRNPKGLTLEDLKWGIQYDNRMATVNVSDRNTVYPPSDGASNLGSVFLLIESANGNYIPAYIRPIRLSELRDGKLKTQLNDLINELTSTDHARRLASIKQLVQFLNLTQEGDNILVGTADKPTVSIVKGGSVIRTFNLADANFDRPRFLESITGLDPRVNITTSTLSDASLLEMFDEAGALTTDLAKLGTSGASYNVYAMDADGNPIITAPVESYTSTLEAGSDLSKAQKKMSSERMGNATYRKDTNGNWYTETDKLVTDPILIEQLNYRNLIRTRGLKPNKVIGMDEIFIINSDINNPLVLVRRKGSQMFAMSKDGAVKTINKVNAELAEKARQEKLQKELETEASNDEFLRTMSDEDRRRAAADGDSVDLGLGETITEEQLVDQMTGNFETEATPQQKTAEEQFARIEADSADLEIAEDENTYIKLSTGEHLPRVTSIVAADTRGERFPEDSPWKTPSTTIGTGIHNFVEDILFNRAGNPENYAARYPNMTNDELQHVAKEAEKLRERIKSRGLTIAGTEVKIAGEVEVFDPTFKERRTISVAGSIDLLLYDRDGKFIIFDFKTKRGPITSHDDAKWGLQTSLYNLVLREKYGLATHDPEVVPLLLRDTKTRDGKYPIPKGAKFENGKDMGGTAVYTTTGKKGEQLVLNGVNYKDATADLGHNRVIPTTNLHIEYSKLTPAEQAMVRTLEDVAPTRDKKAPVVQPEPIRTGEDINKTGTKSLAELQSDKQTDTALSILKSTKDGLGKRSRTLLKSKFPDMPSKIAELDRFLQSKGIATTGITDVEQWLKMIEECK